MPLNGEQKRIIEESIAHLLEFPSDIDQFHQAEKLMTQAFTEPEDPDNDYVWLRKCFDNSPVYLLGITRVGPAVTLGEVQEYFIEYITRCLNKVGKCVHWDPEVILAPLRGSPLWSSPFIGSKASIVESSAHPYELHELEEKIFTGMIGIDLSYDFQIGEDDNDEIQPPSDDDENFIVNLEDEAPVVEFLQFYVTTTIRLSSEETQTVKIIFDDPIPRYEFNNDTEESDYIDSLKPHAKDIAETYAACLVLQKVRTSCLDVTASMPQQPDAELQEGFKENEGSESSDDRASLVFQALTVPRHIRKIVTHAYYYKELCKGTILLSDVYQMSEASADAITQKPVIDLLAARFGGLRFCDLLQYSAHALHNLAQPGIYCLLTQNILTLPLAAGLSPPEVSVITHPVYYSMFMERKIDILDAFYASDDNFKLIVLPPVARLIQTSALLFKQALDLPLHFKPVLSSCHYDAYFTTRQIPWEALAKITESQSRFMSNGKTANCVNTGRLALTDILDYSDETIQTLEQHPKFLHWLDAGLVESSELHPLDSGTFYHLHCIVHMKRLNLAARGNPALINGETDTLLRLFDEIPNAASECCVEPDFLKLSLLFRYAIFLKHDIQHQLTIIMDQPDLHQLLVTLFAHLNEITESPCFDESQKRTECVSRMLDVADRIQKKLMALRFTDGGNVPSFVSGSPRLFHPHGTAVTPRSAYELSTSHASTS